MSKHFHAKRIQVDYSPSDHVLSGSPAEPRLTDGSKQTTGLTTKALHALHGPFEIHERLSEQNYAVQPLQGRKKTLLIVHVR